MFRTQGQRFLSSRYLMLVRSLKEYSDISKKFDSYHSIKSE